MNRSFILLALMTACAQLAVAADSPGCLGKPMPMRVSREMPYALAMVGGSSGYFALDYGANVSSIDLGAMPEAKPLPGSCDPAKLGQPCVFAGLDFGGDQGQASLLTADYSGLNLDLRQAGIIGTDFLSENAYTLNYAGQTISAAGKDSFCQPDALRGAGFAPMSAAGYFSSDLSNLLPLSSLDWKYAGKLSVPNVPAVPVRIAGVETVAQIDTGYSDYIVRHAVNINPALYTQIIATAPKALARWPEGDKKLSTCVPGVLEQVEAYKLNSGAVEFVAMDGAALRAFRQAVVYVKRTPQAAMSCGGIGTHTRPSAQLGGSFMADLGVVVFDPFASRVWARKQ
jgi:hypothetical protein